MSGGGYPSSLVADLISGMRQTASMVDFANDTRIQNRDSGLSGLSENTSPPRDQLSDQQLRVADLYNTLARLKATPPLELNLDSCPNETTQVVHDDIVSNAVFEAKETQTPINKLGADQISLRAITQDAHLSPSELTQVPEDTTTSNPSTGANAFVNPRQLQDAEQTRKDANRTPTSTRYVATPRKRYGGGCGNRNFVKFCGSIIQISDEVLEPTQIDSESSARPSINKMNPRGTEKEDEQPVASDPCGTKGAHGPTPHEGRDHPPKADRKTPHPASDHPETSFSSADANTNQYPHSLLEGITITFLNDTNNHGDQRGSTEARPDLSAARSSHQPDVRSIPQHPCSTQQIRKIPASESTLSSRNPTPLRSGRKLPTASSRIPSAKNSSPSSTSSTPLRRLPNTPRQSFGRPVDSRAIPNVPPTKPSDFSEPTPQKRQNYLRSPSASSADINEINDIESSEGMVWMDSRKLERQQSQISNALRQIKSGFEDLQKRLDAVGRREQSVLCREIVAKRREEAISIREEQLAQFASQIKRQERLNKLTSALTLKAKEENMTKELEEFLSGVVGGNVEPPQPNNSAPTRVPLSPMDSDFMESLVSQGNPCGIRNIPTPLEPQANDEDSNFERPSFEAIDDFRYLVQ